MFLLLLSGTLLMGCNSSTPASLPIKDVEVKPYEEASFTDSDTFKTEIDTAMRTALAHENTLSTALGGYGTIEDMPTKMVEDANNLGTPINILDLFSKIYEAFAWKYKYGWSASKVTYTWKADGRMESGLLVEPTAVFHSKYPMLVFLHPTQTLRKYSPSKNNNSDDQLTTQLAKFAMAPLGYIVVAPDYPGLGDNTDTHPYCLTTLANSAIGMIRAVSTLKTRWDGRIFIMGYSEGGYATLVTAKEIETKHPDLNLVAAAALDGPHSLSDTMHDLMLDAGADYATPYFLPYVVAGYGKAYPNVPELQFENAIAEDVRTLLLKMMDGESTGGEISDIMKRVDPYTGPSSVLTQGTLMALRNQESEVSKKFKENDAYAGWTPSAHLLLSHNVYDDSVPVGNTQNAVKAWNGLTNVKADYFLDYVPKLGTVHAGALPFAYLRGLAWINEQAGK